MYFIKYIQFSPHTTMQIAQASVMRIINLNLMENGKKTGKTTVDYTTVSLTQWLAF